jgi:glycosyltransferase involved in cell wall biosynthesis
MSEVLAGKRIAIVHDQLATAGGAGGAERVLHYLLELFPTAKLYTTVYNPDRMPAHYQSLGIRTSFIQKLPFAKTKYQMYLPLMPAAIEHLDMGEFDIIISCNHSVAKGVIPNPDTLHVCLCYSPIRYAWDKYHEYLRHEKIGLFKRMVIPFLISYLRTWDRISSDRVDYFIAISRFVGERIRKYYRRDSQVIYPPVDLERFSIPDSKPEDYYVMLGRFVSYKRFDLGIQAFNTLDRKLLIIGDGAERDRLKSLAGPNIQFLGRLADDKLLEVVGKAAGLIFAQDEDYGIVPLEAQAAGVPVIAYGHGGALETIRGVFPGPDPLVQGHNLTGVFFQEQTPESLAAAVRYFEANRKTFDRQKARANAERFSIAQFKREMLEAVEKQYLVFSKNP